MRSNSLARLASAGLAALALAEDLLFYGNLTYNEYREATSVLGLSAHIASDAEWRSMTSSDFANYKAIIIPDPSCGSLNQVAFLDETKFAWGPAIAGNIILIGTDPTFHSSSRPGALTLIDDAVRFAAAGNGTGLYFSLSCYYDAVTSSTVNSLSYFGTFTVRGRLACYNDAHIVANASALMALDDADLSNWSCSVHEVFASYPTTGLYGFEPLAIARNAIGEGVQTFADGSTGVPYIIVKGATPAGCGNGIFEPHFGEECDEGPMNGNPGSGCSSSCKCTNGAVAPGVCHPVPANSTYNPTLSTPSVSTPPLFASITMPPPFTRSSSVPLITSSSQFSNSSLSSVSTPAEPSTTVLSTSTSFMNTSSMACHINTPIHRPSNCFTQSLYIRFA
ncbi:Peptidoglycan bound protein [Pleurostoma richardsiae]|uniref:Peptidoglycan bound protein n=1 Tax=Pleurostoma richardsiae TaxID=41990 RepID=A0AA38RUC9_9PEZI|nr:Peptidoglycan bound protein [Pleurostoma richardsiae]